MPLVLHWFSAVPGLAIIICKSIGLRIAFLVAVPGVTKPVCGPLCPVFPLLNLSPLPHRPNDCSINLFPGALLPTSRLYRLSKA